MHVPLFVTYSDLRTPEERVEYLKNIQTHYNFRLVEPEKNLETMEDCAGLAPEEWAEFCQSYEHRNVPNIPIGDLENGKYYHNASNHKFIDI